MWMVGIDTGGTFTDLIAFEVESRELRVAKVSSDPADPSSAVMNALNELFATGIKPEQISSLVHGTTVATNAILEGKGVRTGLLITDGFRAVYEARGWAQPAAIDLIDPFYEKPPLLAPQWLTESVTERMDYTGRPLEDLDENGVRAAVHRLKDKGVEALAVCYLFSFQNADHEERTAAIVKEEAPDWRVSLSSRVFPVIREYLRLSTSVIDAYVGPIIGRYLTRLDGRLKEAGITTPQIFLMQSNGGLMRINMGARFPNQTLLSGPAAGVVAGLDLARGAGHSEVVTLDMGGTSTDISVISGGRTEETNEGRIANQDIGTPMLAVRTLGAGGGTIAWIGGDGLLKVGPQSAGAVPGPVCYGCGGEEPTVTDANLLLGVLSDNNILGGRMSLDKAQAEQAIKTHIADPLGLGVIEAAAGILKIVNTNMAVDLRLAFQDRGEDPRKFMLAAFGGAGPMHAAELARDVKIPRVLVPLYPGINSAMGLLQTSVRHVYLQSSVGPLSEFATDRMNDLLTQLEARAMADVREEGFEPSQVSITRQVDMRYKHQGYQLTVDCPKAAVTEGDKATLKAAFDATHQRVYGASAPDEDAEVVTFRVLAEIAVPQLEIRELSGFGEKSAKAVVGERMLYDLDRGDFLTATVYDRAKLSAGNRVTGPAIVQQFDSTTVVLDGMEAHVDTRHNIIIETGVA